MLFGNTYYTLYGPNHFLVSFPRCDLLPFGNHKTYSPKLNYFFRIFCCLHNVIFHCWIPIVFVACILSSYNFSNSIIILVKTFIELLFLSFPPTTSIMYSMGINGCNPYTNWYGAYPIVTMYAILYENNNVDRCSSQSILFSLTNLVNNIPNTLLVDLAYPFP